MSDKLAKIITILTFLAAVLASFVNTENPENKKIISILQISFLALAAVIIGGLQILKYRKGKKSKNQSGIIAKCAKYIKYLHQIAKTNHRRLNCFQYNNQQQNILRLKKKLQKKRLIKKYYFNSIVDENHLTIVSQKNEKAKTFKNRLKTNFVIKNADLETSILISEKIIMTAKDMSRILLQIEQHKYRIKLGHFIINHSNNIFDDLNAEIDFVGWTNILMGHYQAGFKAIDQAILTIDQKLTDFKGKTIDEKFLNTTSEKDKNILLELYLLKVRALRHLGTTYYTYGKIPDVCKYLKEGNEILAAQQLQEYCLNNQHKKYHKLKSGINNNIYLAEYYEMKKKQSSISLENYHNYMKNINNEIKTIESFDMHRVAKLLVLKNQIISYALSCGILTDDTKKEAIINQGENFKCIEKIFDHNIYFDDALEVYVGERIQYLFDNIHNLLKNQ